MKTPKRKNKPMLKEEAVFITKALKVVCDLHFGRKDELTKNEKALLKAYENLANVLEKKYKKYTKWRRKQNEIRNCGK